MDLYHKYDAQMKIYQHCKLQNAFFKDITEFAVNI
jgi:hypothetical protein